MSSLRSLREDFLPHGAKIPLVLFALTFAVLCAFAGPRVKQASPNNHFAHLAESWLHGQLSMLEDPPHGNDWASVDTITLRNGDTYRGVFVDRRERTFRATTGEFYRFEAHELRGVQTERTYYVSFPPAPAALMLPGVAIWGTAFNDVLFTIFFASCNASLFFLLLLRLRARGAIDLPDRDLYWATALFVFGTAHFWCSVLGAVWFTALVVGVTFTLLYVHASIDAKYPFLAGLFLGIAFAARTPLLYSTIFFAAYFFFPGGRLRTDWGSAFWRDGLLFVAAPLVIGSSLLWMNYERFDRLGEFGHVYLANGQIQRIKDYGLFNVHFLTKNLTAAFALVPTFLPEKPWILISRHGLALWFTTPALLWFLAARYGSEGPALLLRRACLAALLVIALPHLLYQNTGWVQFGYRFSLDYLVYLTLLLLLGRSRISRPMMVAIVVGILINAFGAVTFDRMHVFYGEFLVEAGC